MWSASFITTCAQVTAPCSQHTIQGYPKCKLDLVTGSDSRYENPKVWSHEFRKPKPEIRSIASHPSRAAGGRCLRGLPACSRRANRSTVASGFGLRVSFGIRFVLLKLHAKWLQFFVVSSHVFEFPGVITYCGKTAIYKHLQQQEHWHRGTRRPRVSQKLVFGPMAKLCPIWFWLCQVRISGFGVRISLLPSFH